MQFNIIFKTIFEYIHKKFRFAHTNTFCKYRKNYAHRLACILFSYTDTVRQLVGVYNFIAMMAKDIARVNAEELSGLIIKLDAIC